MDNPSQQQQLTEAQQIARENGLFFSEKKDGARTHFMLFRRTPTGPVFLGRRSTVIGLRCFVSKAATVR